ncbi:MAG: hypothetical protein M3442_01725 [Chloroflexota bacterium]|nr:hypothetical protein [Chloroflexota bacterium]
MPGADYEAILAELAKYGANLILATQSLAQLEALDNRQQRALRSTLFSNLDGLFAFHTSAEDARYLIAELGEGIDEQDLLELGEYRCYAKLSARGERLPVFSVRLDPPPPSDGALAGALATASAQRFGCDRATVEAALAAMLERIVFPHGPPPSLGPPLTPSGLPSPPPLPSSPPAASPPGAGPPGAGSGGAGTPPRSRGRPRKHGASPAAHREATHREATHRETTHRETTKEGQLDPAKPAPPDAAPPEMTRAVMRPDRDELQEHNVRSRR